MSVLQVITSEPRINQHQPSVSHKSLPSNETIERRLRQTLKTSHRKSGNWAAEIRDHTRKVRYLLGTYTSSIAATDACLSKLSEFDSSQLKGLFRSNSIEGQCYTASIYGKIVSACNLEEIERVLHPVQTTKIYKGVWKRKTGNWVAMTRDPFTNVRVLLGKFDFKREAFVAYLSKNLEFEAQLMEKPKNQPIVFSELESELSHSPNLVADSGVSDLPDDCGDDDRTDSSGVEVGKDQFQSSSMVEDCSFGLKCGSAIVDNHGFLLGEFSRLDDLRICDIEDEDDVQLMR